MRLALVVILSLAAAGCVSVPSATQNEAATPAPTDPFHGLGDPLILDHDHSDASLHELSTPSMTLLAQTRFAELVAPTLAFGEADLLGDKYLVVAGFLGTGFFIADISDPASPRAVSFTPEPGIITDIKASKSGNFVFVGLQGAETGVKAYYVGLPERPVPAGFFPLPGNAFESGCHMLAVHLDHLYCAPNDVTVRIFEIVEAGPVVALVPVGIYAPLGGPIAPVLGHERIGSQLTHDMTVQDDPLTGEPVMYVSFWDYGLAVVDVSDPSAPTELGVWKGEGAEDWGTYMGAVHTSMGGLVGGKRVLATVPEYADVPSLHLIDATDYASMTALGVWAPKTAEEWGDSARQFSTHNFQFVGETIYMAMYHGGVWVLDASDPAMPKPIGYHLPSGAPSALPVGPFSGPSSTSTWDVLVKDGVIYAIDMPGGVFVLQHEADAGKVGHTSFA